MEFIDLKSQYKRIKADVLNEINEVLESGQYILGNKVSQLEKQLANYVGAKHCIAVADGSKALLIALMALGIKRNDEIIVPAFTFFATASMATLLGIKPVFIDVEPNTYNIDPKLIEAAITSKTKGIIGVGLFGQCANYEEISRIATKHKIVLIEDAAQSFGAMRHNKKSGVFGTISCTSFFPAKTLGCYGDGGACFTDNDELANKIRSIRIHGQEKRYNHVRLGVNGRMDELQAAILLAKLRIFNDEVIARQRIGDRYTQLLANSQANCVLPQVAPNNTHVYHQYTILVNHRDRFMQELQKRGIPTAVHYPIPLHLQKIFLTLYPEPPKLPVSEHVSQRVVSLPMHPYLDEKTQDYIVNNICEVLNILQ
jgi:UDP-2-acetamido-2-deoxy-ribo-hexuluronate aminotransferase